MILLEPRCVESVVGITDYTEEIKVGESNRGDTVVVVLMVEETEEAKFGDFGEIYMLSDECRHYD